MRSRPPSLLRPDAIISSWNHWFWITAQLVVLALVLSGSQEGCNGEFKFSLLRTVAKYHEVKMGRGKIKVFMYQT